MMSEKMAESHDRMLNFIADTEWLIDGLDNFDTTVVVYHDDGSTFLLSHATVVVDSEDDSYIWVLCEHIPDLIFCVDDLHGYKVLEGCGLRRRSDDKNYRK